MQFLALRESLAAENSVPWIGGRVVADSAQPLGFYFDPATTMSGVDIAETLQTSLAALKRDPVGAAAAGHIWYVTAFVVRTIPKTATLPR